MEAGPRHRQPRNRPPAPPSPDPAGAPAAGSPPRPLRSRQAASSRRSRAPGTAPHAHPPSRRTGSQRPAQERLRLQAVERFECGQKNVEVATALRISVRSVERWRRAWREGGEAGVLPKGPPGGPRLSEIQIAELERELERGPLAHGWADHRWTPARIKTLIG
ncbi:helix-turn-helix domain-containing protein [Streptomyces sp. NPDC002265]|uniref:helix-turn-helix domain-containing protein n=1 Tax=Streptomyces sp. NPDC002265 TaxID=3154415 RepID=UPI003317F52E